MLFIYICKLIKIFLAAKLIKICLFSSYSILVFIAFILLMGNINFHRPP